MAVVRANAPGGRCGSEADCARHDGRHVACSGVLATSESGFVMHRYSFMVHVGCVAALVSGCAVAVDEPVPAPEEPPVLLQTRDATPLPVEESAPTSMGWDLEDLLLKAKAATAPTPNTDIVRPATPLRSITPSQPCFQCLSTPVQSQLPRPGGDLR